MKTPTEANSKLPKKDVQGQGQKKLPKGAAKGPNRPTKITFKTGKSG